jgi:hypothetical protein
VQGSNLACASFKPQALSTPGAFHFLPLEKQNMPAEEKNCRKTTEGKSQLRNGGKKCPLAG